VRSLCARGRLVRLVGSDVSALGLPRYQVGGAWLCAESRLAGSGARLARYGVKTCPTCHTHRHDILTKLMMCLTHRQDSRQKLMKWLTSIKHYDVL
jgi:hypothetical protein